MDQNKVEQDGAIAIAKAITINKKLKILSLCHDTKESVMKSLYCNNTINELKLPLTQSLMIM